MGQSPAPPDAALANCSAIPCNNWRPGAAGWSSRSFVSIHHAPWLDQRHPIAAEPECEQHEGERKRQCCDSADEKRCAWLDAACDHEHGRHQRDQPCPPNKQIERFILEGVD